MARKIQTAAGQLYLTPLSGAETQRTEEKQAVEMLIRELWGADIQKKYHPNGRPYLAGQQDLPPISIAHTTGWAALLTGDSPCGIDIEPPGRDASRVAGRIAVPDELSFAEIHYPKNPPLWVWCAKEAAYKAAAMRRDIDFRSEICIIPEKGHPLQIKVDSEIVRIGHLETDDLLIVFASFNN